MNIFNCKILFNGPRNSNKIAITFDDGPHRKFTSMILDLLAEKQTHATFFATGKSIVNNKELAEEIASRGHLLGNHTYNHVSALSTNRERLRDEIVRTRDVIEDISGKPNHYLRPPYGHISPALLSICRETELSLVLWSLNSKDHHGKPAPWIVNRIKKRIKSGAVLLFHEGHFSDRTRDYSPTITALAEVLEDIMLKGLTPVTIAEFFEAL